MPNCESFGLLPLTYTGIGGRVQGEQGARNRVGTRNKVPNIVAVVVLVRSKFGYWIFVRFIQDFFFLSLMIRSTDPPPVLNERCLAQ